MKKIGGFFAGLIPAAAIVAALGIIGGTERGTLPGVALFGLIPCAGVVLLAAYLMKKKEGRTEK